MKKIIMEIKVSTAMVNNSTNEKNTTSQLKSMNTNIAMTYRDGNASLLLVSDISMLAMLEILGLRRKQGTT
jgi:hypothetical protein